LCRSIFAFNQDGEQQALGGDELVTGLFCYFFGLLEYTRQLRRKIELAGCALPGDFGEFLQGQLDAGQCLTRIATCVLDQTGDEAVWIVQQHLQEMLDTEFLVIFP